MYIVYMCSTLCAVPYPRLYEHLWTRTVWKFIVYQQVFRRFDKDKNGTISVENLGKVMQAMGQDVTQEDVRSMIQDYDKSGKRFLIYC